MSYEFINDNQAEFVTQQPYNLDQFKFTRGRTGKKNVRPMYSKHSSEHFFVVRRIVL